jgi:hypothetical protein
LFLTKNRQKPKLIQISGENSPFKKKTDRQISPSFKFLGESIIKGLSIGYTYTGPVKNCGELSRNLRLEARHCCYATKLKNKTLLPPLLQISLYKWENPVVGPKV